MTFNNQNCTVVFASEVLSVSDEGVTHFAFACKQGSQTDATATLLVGRMPLSGAATLFAINAPDILDFSRDRAPYLQVDEFGTAHLLYVSKSTLQLWHVTFNMDNDVNVETVDVTLDTPATSIAGSYGSLRAQRQANGKIHVLLHAQIDNENATSTWSVHYGVFVPGSGNLSARAITTSHAPQELLSNIVVYSP